MPMVECPKCRRKVEFYGNPTRPFCSERCKLLDLGDWAMEKYRVPAEEATPSEESSTDSKNYPEEPTKKH